MLTQKLKQNQKMELIQNNNYNKRNFIMNNKQITEVIELALSNIEAGHETIRTNAKLGDSLLNAGRWCLIGLLDDLQAGNKPVTVVSEKKTTPFDNTKTKPKKKIVKREFTGFYGRVMSIEDVKKARQLWESGAITTYKEGGELFDVHPNTFNDTVNYRRHVNVK